jgi:outer membrane protein assembly factor BamB
MKATAPLLCLVFLVGAALHAADPVLDWKRATELYQREQKGEPLNEEEKAYLYEARRQRTPAAQRPPFKGLLPAPGAPATVVATVAAAAKPGAGFDWPTFRGATRDDVSKETGLLKSWPAGGPKKLWSYDKAGMGYSGFAIADGRLYTLGSRDDKETLICLDANTGKELWAQSFGPDNKSQYNVGWGEGPRSSPTADADRVYALGATGEIVCFATKDGKKIWSRNMADFGGKSFGWGYSESPLVDGDKLVCTPGGSQGAIVALNKMTGATVWQSKEMTDTAQYSSLVPVTMHGKPQYVQLMMQSIVGISAQDGKLLWRAEFPGRTAVIPTPLVRDNQVFVTAGYGVGCKAITISANGSADEVFRKNEFSNHHGGVVLVGDHIYGHSDRGGWTCMDWKSGDVKWQEQRKVGKGSIHAADGMLYLLDEKSGDCVLVEPSPSSFNEKSRFKLDPQSPNRNSKGGVWTHPVVANGRLHLRDQEFIHCYAVK